MKIRLQGAPSEVESVLTALNNVLDIHETSEPYANRGNSKLVRIYLEVGGIRTAEPDWSALRDACDEYSAAYMGEDNSLIPAAIDKIRAALRGEDPYNPEARSD